MRSIFGECTGNVRSTPTPNDCLRTVKVSRAPAPCRLSTIPSKTCTRRRVPSMTWKCTRTVSPALKRGTLRSWARSRSWMTLLMERGAGRPTARVPNGRAARLLEADPVGRPVDEEDDADQLVAGHPAPAAGVAGLGTVVAHHEVRARRDRLGLSVMLAVRESALGWDVRLFQLHEFGRAGFLDRDETLVVLVHGVAGQTDHTFHERAPFAALVFDPLGRVEDDDVAAGRRSEVEADAAREHAVARVAETAGTRLAFRAVQRRFHRGRRDAVRVHDPLLQREHDQDRAGDGEDPVERDPHAVRKAGKEAGDLIPAVPCGIALGPAVVGEQVVPALVSVI